MNDIFLQTAFDFSSKSPKTREEYSKWISRLCQFSGRPHPLDVSPEDVKRFYLSLIDTGFAPASLNIVRAAILYFYTVLCETEAPEIYRYTQGEALRDVFPKKRKYAYTLPAVATQEEMSAFLTALPNTTAGNVLREIYRTGNRYEDVLATLPFPVSCSRGTCQQVAARTARQVGIAHGFGLRGIRASSLVHRLQEAKNDLERVRVFKESGLSYQQFRLYRKAAGLL